MSSIFDVIVVGSYSIDLIFSGMADFPQPGKDVVCKDFKATPGEAFIPAVCMHRLGMKVGWAADFGNDEYSLLALKCAREEGLDESLFVIHDHPYRRISVAASNPTELGFLTYYDPAPKIPAAIPALTKSLAKIVYIPGLFYGLQFEAGRKLIGVKKMKLVMDGNSSSGVIYKNNKKSNQIKNSIKYTEIFLPNAAEAIRLTGESNLNNAIQKLGQLCPLVVVKDGANGSMAYFNHEIIRTPGIPVKPVDTTGAGDNFNAGFLCAWLEGQSIETCMVWGSVTGGLSTTELGGTTRKISLDTVKETIKMFNLPANDYPR